MKQTTQRDVALHAGVSRATVSYVVSPNREAPVAISEKTRQKVLDAVRELGYQPDARAQTLISGTTRIIGILLPDMRNPHFWELLEAIERRAHVRGYSLLVYHSALERSQEKFALQELGRRRIDGVVLISSFPPYSADVADDLGAARRPVVDLSNVESPFDCVISSYDEGAAQMMEHLFALGHRRIGFVYGVASPALGRDRLDAYTEAIRQRGLPADDKLIVRCGTSAAEGYAAARALLAQEDRPTAIIAINDLIAFSVLRAAADLELAVPRDLSVCGFDNVQASKYAVPRLTTVDRDAGDVAEAALRLLLSRMNDKSTPRMTARVACRLIARETTGPAPSILAPCAGTDRALAEP